MGVSIGVFSNGRLIPPGVSVGLKETERLPDTGVAVGTTSLCTGGSVVSTRFFLACGCETSRLESFSEADKGEEPAAGILRASARGLDIRSRDCRMRLAVALVTPHG